MKTLTSILAVFFLSAAFAAADLIIVQKIDGAGQDRDLTMKLKNGKALMDVSPDISTIYDSATGDVLTIMRAQKMYMKVPASATKALLANMRSGSPTPDASPAGRPKLKSTGKKETVGPYSTEVYTSEISGMQVTYWIAKDFPNYAAVLSKMMAMQQGASTMGGALSPDPKDFPGMPVKTEVVFNGQKITTTLVSVKEQQLDAADFQVPEGYTEMKMPAMPATPPGSESKAPE